MSRPLRRAKDMSAQLAVAEVEGKRFESEKKVPETGSLGSFQDPNGGWLDGLDGVGGFNSSVLQDQHHSCAFG